MSQKTFGCKAEMPSRARRISRVMFRFFSDALMATDRKNWPAAAGTVALGTVAVGYPICIAQQEPQRFQKLKQFWSSPLWRSYWSFLRTCCFGFTRKDEVRRDCATAALLPRQVACWRVDGQESPKGFSWSSTRKTCKHDMHGSFTLSFRVKFRSLIWCLSKLEKSFCFSEQN